MLNSTGARPLFVPIFIGLNILIYIIWTFTTDVEFMTTHFLVSMEALAEGRWWVLFTSIFSHNMFLHLLVNMIVLSDFGGLLERVLGVRTFLIFYFVAGAISSLTHAVVSAYLLSQPDLPALGASGAISGLILVFSLMFPSQKILIFGLLPLPAIVGALAFIGLDIWGLVAQAEGGGLPIGHGAHLGGAFTGILFYFFGLRNKRRRRAFTSLD